MKPEESKSDALLRSRGLRPTRARRRIIELFGQPHFHPSAEEIEALMAEQGDRISPATLYQNLNKLADAGLLDRFTGPDGLARFDANRESHHHLICVNCFKIVDVFIDGLSLGDWALFDHRTKKRMRGYEVKSARIEFRAVCPDCCQDRKSESLSGKSSAL